MHLKLLSHAEQVAEHLRSQLIGRRWRNALPGVYSLAKDLGVNHNTIHAALQLLEQEGLLAGQGRGRPRRITLPQALNATRPLRVKILCYEQLDRGQPFDVELLARLQQAGFAADFAPKSLRDLGMNVKSVARFVKSHPADAWVICAGSREILEWFAHGPVPALALFGRFTGLPIAASSPRKAPAVVAAVRKLVALGHRRIVMLTRRERRHPRPALVEQIFLDELELQGLRTGKYNLPDWEEHPKGLQAGLDALFRYTPPTAMIVPEPEIFLAVERYLGRRGISIPEQVSLLCDEFDPAFQWFDPPVSHIHWTRRPVINRVVRWASNIAEGKKDLRQTLFKARLVEGGTIGPACLDR